MAAFLCVAFALPLSADDGATAIGAGGLVPIRETRITMAKEVLQIALDKVVADYDFRNDTAAPITTEIAFPIPAYANDPEEVSLKQAGFDDFKLFVDGVAKPFQTEVKGVLHGKDVSPQLRTAHIDIASFGHSTSNGSSADFPHLPPAQQQALLAAGIFRKEGTASSADYKVEKRYYWSQTFPAHGMVHIRHEYTPVTGAQLMAPFYLSDLAAGKGIPEVTSVVEPLCLYPQEVKKLGMLKHSMIAFNWVDFILTTANSWKRPIEDFTLLVERGGPADVVSVCWDGRVEKLDARHFRAHAQNLIPTKELRIGFYSTVPDGQ